MRIQIAASDPRTTPEELKTLLNDLAPRRTTT